MNLEGSMNNLYTDEFLKKILTPVEENNKKTFYSVF